MQMVIGTRNKKGCGPKNGCERNAVACESCKLTAANVAAQLLGECGGLRQLASQGCRLARGVLLHDCQKCQHDRGCALRRIKIDERASNE